MTQTNGTTYTEDRALQEATRAIREAEAMERADERHNAVRAARAAAMEAREQFLECIALELPQAVRVRVAAALAACAELDGIAEALDHGHVVETGGAA